MMKHSDTFDTETDDSRIFSSIEIGKSTLTVKTNKKDLKPDPNHGTKETILQIEFHSDSQTILELLRFIYSELNPDRESTVSDTFCGEVILKEKPTYREEMEKVERGTEIEVLIDRDAVFFTTKGVPAIYLNRRGISPEMSDRDLSNLDSFKLFLSEVLSGVDTHLEGSVEQRLNDRLYGENVRRYLNEGDTCNAMGMNTQSILSYVLAAEWAGITYLEHERGIDLIEEQKKNGTWYKFSGENSVIEKVNEQFKLDQTTKKLFDTIYKELRNISAHHKTGEIHDEEVRMMKQRVIDFITELDSQRQEQ